MLPTNRTNINHIITAIFTAGAAPDWKSVSINLARMNHTIGSSWIYKSTQARRNQCTLTAFHWVFVVMTPWCMLLEMLCTNLWGIHSHLEQAHHPNSKNHRSFLFFVYPTVKKLVKLYRLSCHFFFTDIRAFIVDAFHNVSWYNVVPLYQPIFASMFTLCTHIFCVQNHT